MKKILMLAMILMALVAAPFSFLNAQQVSAKVELPVPFISEVPDGRWVGSWKNACEEASIAMVDRYYAGMVKTTIAWQKAYMSNLFVIERKLWKSDANTDVDMTVKLINDYSSFSAYAKDDPTIEDMKSELAAGRPVIVPIDGFELANENIPFLAAGSGYHMFVLIGYDEDKKAFIAHDNGDLKDGIGIEYGYERIMNTLHDYSFLRKKTDGPARAIFTHPKLAKTAASHRIYFLHDGIKQYVSHPAVFAQRKWDWKWVNLVSDSFLNGFKDGTVVKP
jgi:Peptidase_C39 like family